MNLAQKVTAALIVTLGAIALVAILSLLFAFPVKWLWNATLPELFGLKTISVWMAWKISMLTGILFKSTSSSSK